MCSPSLSLLPDRLTLYLFSYYSSSISKKYLRSFTVLWLDKTDMNAFQNISHQIHSLYLSNFATRKSTKSDVSTNSRGELIFFLMFLLFISQLFPIGKAIKEDLCQKIHVLIMIYSLKYLHRHQQWYCLQLGWSSATDYRQNFSL